MSHTSRAGLRPVAVTRSDGVQTTVWKRIDGASATQRVQGIREAKTTNAVPHATPIDCANAFDATNIQSVDEPLWWDAYVEKSAEGYGRPEFGSKPELLDIIDTPLGEAAVVWQPTIQSSKDIAVRKRGYEISVLELKLVDSGEDLGYIRVASMTEDSFRRSFGSDEFAPFRWRNVYGGASYPGLGFDGFSSHDEEFNPPKRPEDIDALRGSVWLNAIRDMEEGVTLPDGSYKPPFQISKEDIPEPKVVQKDLVRLARTIRKSMDMSMEAFKVPYIDYSRVTSDELSGKGFGTAMYVYAAKRLGRDGYQLRASETQTDSAQALWDRMAVNYPGNANTVSWTWYGNTIVSPALDFRV